MMKVVLAVLIVIWMITLGQSQSIRPDDICGLPVSAFGSGERLTYKLYYNLSFIWIPAGEAVFQLSETDSTYEARVTGRSYGSYDNIFKVRDEFSSSIDKETMLPLRFLRKVEEGDQLRYDSLVFDYQKELIYSHNGPSRASAVKDTFGLDDCAQDLVSIMYNLRNINTSSYGRGDSIHTKIFFDREWSDVDIRYLKKERKKVKGLGRFQTVKVQPEVILGSVFKEGDIMHVWISDDENKIPLVIESPILVGKVKAILHSYEGLKFPFAVK